MPRQKCTDEFALYRGDELLVVGTADEVIDFMGWKKRNTLWFLCSPAYKKRIKGEALVAYRISLEGEVEDL